MLKPQLFRLWCRPYARRCPPLLVWLCLALVTALTLVLMTAEEVKDVALSNSARLHYLTELNIRSIPRSPSKYIESSAENIRSIPPSPSKYTESGAKNIRSIPRSPSKYTESGADPTSSYKSYVLKPVSAPKRDPVFRYDILSSISEHNTQKVPQVTVNPPPLVATNISRDQSVLLDEVQDQYFSNQFPAEGMNISFKAAQQRSLNARSDMTRLSWETTPHQPAGQADDGQVLLTNGIFWSRDVENSIPKGVSEQEADSWLTNVRSASLHSVQTATWNRCGRPQNAFLTFGDGTSVCARYRTPRDRLVLGEVLSYWLSRILGMDSVPPVTLTLSDPLLQQKPQDLGSQDLRWEQGQMVALIRWIDTVDSRPNVKVLMPRQLLAAYRSGQPITSDSLLDNKAIERVSQKNDFFSRNKSESESRTNVTTTRHSKDSSSLQIEAAAVLAQWGTMIIFDYLTGNYDRVASMQDGAELEKDSSIMEQSIRNLRPSKRGAKLWLIDNESGLLDAYTVLYLQHSINSKFISFHESMLRTMCVFQSSVVRHVERLHQKSAPHRALVRYAARRDRLVREMETDESFQLFREKFAQRLDNVVKWIRQCRELGRVNKS